MPRLLILLLWPLAEIALFVLIGGRIGVWLTLLWIVVTGILGVVLLRQQAKRGAMMMRGGAIDPAALQSGAPIGDIMNAFAGVFLLLPGFLTDAIGILLLLPPVQTLAKAALLSRMATFGQGLTANAGPFAKASQGFDDTSFAPKTQGPRPGTAAHSAEVIDGEWIEVPDQDNRRPPSKWTELN